VNIASSAQTNAPASRGLAWWYPQVVSLAQQRSWFVPVLYGFL